MARKKNANGAFTVNGWEFKKAFPTLADALLIYKEFDFSGLVRAGAHSVHRDGLLLSCGNSRCHEGGYDLRSEIAMILTQMNGLSKEIHLQCNGWETQAKRSHRNICTGSIEGTLHLKTHGKASAIEATRRPSQRRRGY